MVPHLTTSLTGPLNEIERLVLGKRPEIEHWLRAQFAEHEVPFYASVDLRNAGFKLAPVDTNLFPGGFNNLNPDFWPLCVHAAMSAIQKLCPDARRFVLVPENHTRNLHYLHNVAVLRRILEGAGLEVRIGSLIPELSGPTTLSTADGESILLEPLRRVGNRVGLDGFDPCAVVLNNDLSAGIPSLLQGLEQVVVPPLKAGWSTRRKSQHFAAFNTVAEDFSRLLGIDPWFVNPAFATCSEVNFADKAGEECLAAAVDRVLDATRAKYAEYGITEAPFAIVKADAGTYGMGIMTARSPDDVRNLNRKARNKMAVVKEGLEVSQVIIQEGVPTFEQVGEAIAEPVVYMIDRYVVGGFYRVHQSRSRQESLNAPGMHFVPLPFETSCILPDGKAPPEAAPNRFYAYGVVARLALLAASIELEQTEPGERPSPAQADA